jgi:hypothetical protein
MAFIDCAILLTGVFLLCGYVIRTQDLQLSLISVDLLAESKFDIISPVQLGVMRIFFGIVVWSVDAFLLFDRAGIDFTVLTRDNKKRSVHLIGFDRFVMFTVWCWSLQVK